MPEDADTGSACYTPNTFRPNGQPLLSKADWQSIQLYINTAKQLPLTKATFPDEAVLPIFRALHDAALDFETTTLPAAHSLANELYNYGNTAKATFNALVKLLEQPNIDRASIEGLFTNLIQQAQGEQAKAKDIFTQVQTFEGVLSTSEGQLETAIRNEVDAVAGLATQISQLNLDISTQQATIQSAQSQILSDKQVIHDTVYYSWIPLIGTIVAVAEIIVHNNDIKDQIAKIQTATAAVQADNDKLRPLNARLGQLNLAKSATTGQRDQIKGVLPAIQKIEGAWGTISLELQNVLSNIKLAEENALQTHVKCLAEVQLTTAVAEWQDVANDAHNFLMNFYLLPVETKSQAA